MRKYTFALAIAGLLLAGWTPARAQQDWGRAHRIIDKTLNDLHRVEHHEAWATGDRGHYEAAEHNLMDVRRDLDRNHLDRGHLQATINEVEYITHVDAVRPRARQVLAEDVREMRRLDHDWRWR